MSLLLKYDFSYSDLITEAINFFCARWLVLENDPYLETRQKH